MDGTHETIADIIAEKRQRADEIERDCAEKMKRGEMVSDCYARELVADIRREADRMEAALKRETDVLKQRINELDAEIAAKDEVIKRLNDAIAEEQRRKLATAEKSSAFGDCAKLREALVYLIQNESTLFEANLTGGELELLHLITNKARAALAEPLRNCDVGTAREQMARYNSLCHDHRSYGTGCGGCPLCGEPCCELAWAQMPYTEGGAK